MKRHPEELDEDLVGLVALISKENLEELFRVELRRYLPAGHGFFKLTHQFIRVLLKDPVIRDIVDKLPLIEEWSQEALDAMEVRGDNAVNTQIFAIQMVIDLWKEFPDKFTDKLIEDQVLERLKDNLRRKDKSPQILFISTFSSLVDLLEHIIDNKSDLTSRNAAIKIHNLIAHILADLHPGNSTLKEFYLDQTLRLLEKEYLNLNEMTPVLLRVLQNHSNFLNCIDMRVLTYLMSKTDQLMERNLLCLMDFNCHIVMSDINTIIYSKKHIRQLVPACSHSELILPHLVKFVRVLFNWLYKNRLSTKDKTQHSEVNKIRENHLLQLALSLLADPKVSFKLKIVLRNIAAFVNFQVRKYVLDRRAKEKTTFVSPEFKEIICYVEPIENTEASVSARTRREKKETPEEILKRYDNVFEVHLNDPEGRDLSSQLDKLLVTVDLSRKDGMSMSEMGNLDTHKTTSVSGDPQAIVPLLTEYERHQLKLEEFKRIDAKLKKIQKGSFADKKALEDINKKRFQRDEEHHKRIQEQAIKSLKDQHEQVKLQKQVNDVKVITGFVKSDLVIEMTLEQLMRPLDSQLQEVETLQKRLMYFDENALLDQKIALRCWFKKNGVLLKAIYNHFAGMLSKITDQSNKLISTAELFRFCQTFGLDKKLSLQDIKEIVGYLNLPLITPVTSPEAERPVGVLGMIDSEQFEYFLCEVAHRYHLPDDSKPTAVMLDAIKEQVVRDISTAAACPELRPFLKTGLTGYKRPLPKAEKTAQGVESITVETYEYLRPGLPFFSTGLSEHQDKSKPVCLHAPTNSPDDKLESTSIATAILDELFFEAFSTRLFLPTGFSGNKRYILRKEKAKEDIMSEHEDLQTEKSGQPARIQQYLQAVNVENENEQGELPGEDEPIKEVCYYFDDLITTVERKLELPYRGSSARQHSGDHQKPRVLSPMQHVASHTSHLELLESLQKEEARKRRDLFIKDQIRKYKEVKTKQIEEAITSASRNKSAELARKPKDLERRTKVKEEIEKYRKDKQLAYERVMKEKEDKQAKEAAARKKLVASVPKL